MDSNGPGLAPWTVAHCLATRTRGTSHLWKEQGFAQLISTGRTPTWKAENDAGWPLRVWTHPHQLQPPQGLARLHPGATQSLVWEGRAYPFSWV